MDQQSLMALLISLLGAIVLLVVGGFQVRVSRAHKRVTAENERSRNIETHRAAAERDYHASQREFTEIMQITRDEDEAHALLKRHLERTLEGSEVLVLNRNHSDDRLEPTTELPAGSALIDRLEGAKPDSCLAIRLGKTHERSQDQETLLSCELCGVAGATSTCVPSLVGGEMIGAVLVQHPSPLDSDEKRRVEESLAQASPVLANLRNLALAQTRALTDGLTGLPNRRSIDDTLKRMSAQAIRTATPLAVVLFDLDHFKQINDVFGHEKGDEVLAAVAAVIESGVRGSDFAGRHGREEFILVLPDTDRDSA
ncbi:MAG: GGDEF domain-containing protein, partial [Actinobacteria bacterium]|nr:GGDEF domain-containing protein [Actinomycetota bacterium]